MTQELKPAEAPSEIARRYIFRGKIVLETPLHIGSGRSDALTDSPVRTGVGGLPVIPGTSLGGLLRTQAERFGPFLDLPGAMECKGRKQEDREGESDEACTCIVCQIFGSVNPKKELLRTTRLTVADAVLDNRELPTEIRDGIGVSRRRQTVAQGLKFDWQVLPRFATFQLEIQLETSNLGHLQLICAALGEMVAGRVFLGGRSGRGTGRFRLELDNPTEIGFEASELDKLRDFLKSKPAERYNGQSSTQTSGQEFLSQNLKTLGQRLQLQPSEPPETQKIPNFIELELLLQFDQGLLINNPAHALLEAGDNSFVRTALNADGTQTVYLPGSSLRGMLRSHAEKIARTLSLARAVKDKSQPDRDFLELNQYEYQEYFEYVAACDPIAVPADDKKETEPTGEEYAATACSHFLQNYRHNQKPNLSFKEILKYSCLGCQLFGNSFLGGRLKLSDAFPLNLEGLDPRGDTLQRMDFVAIDRFTGGARDTAKFEARPHFSGEGQDKKMMFRVVLSLRDLAIPADNWMIGWLTYLLRDLWLGDLRLGLGKTKGLGKIKLGEIAGSIGAIRVGSLHPDTAWFSSEKKLSALWQPVSEGFSLLQAYQLGLNLKDKSSFSAESELLKDFAKTFNKRVNDFTRHRFEAIPI